MAPFAKKPIQVSGQKLFVVIENTVVFHIFKTFNFKVMKITHIMLVEILFPVLVQIVFDKHPYSRA